MTREDIAPSPIPGRRQFCTDNIELDEGKLSPSGDNFNASMPSNSYVKRSHSSYLSSPRSLGWQLLHLIRSDLCTKSTQRPAPSLCSSPLCLCTICHMVPVICWELKSWNNRSSPKTFCWTPCSRCSTWWEWGQKTTNDHSSEWSPCEQRASLLRACKEEEKCFDLV